MFVTATSAIVTVGTEITSGLRLDTNTREIAQLLHAAGYQTGETVSLPDDAGTIATALRRLVAAYELVVVTGGLGPTHDDITRVAASRALGLGLAEDPQIAAALGQWAGRHQEPAARAQVLSQALVLEGACVLPVATGTAPGQVVPTTGGGRLVLLPGPPDEMRPMLVALLRGEHAALAAPAELACVGIPESDAQLAAERALAGFSGVQLAILASPGDVHVVLMDAGAGESGLRAAAVAVREALGEHCYSDDGSSMAEVVIHAATAAGLSLAAAESCTGGMVGAALTSVPGSSSVFLGSVVAYADEVKMSQLDVPPGLLAQYGAVSEETARAMAEGARDRLGADIAISITGIAGPGGGTPDKPVGTVWFGVAVGAGSRAVMRRFGGDRAGVRARATIFALDLVRQTIERHS